MKKQKLPDGWIVVHSKSHPDRIYYFNVKTNRSSWEEPKESEICENSSTKSVQKTNKRKRLSEDSSRPTTPELLSKIDNEPSKRTKLKAKRKQTASSSSNCDTPQMCEIRERILKKKMSIPTTNQKMYKKPPRPPNLKKQSIKDKSSKISKSEEKGNKVTDSKNKNSKMTGLNNKDNMEEKKLTPQMRALKEKLLKISKPAAKAKDVSCDKTNDSTETKSSNSSKISQTTGETSCSLKSTASTSIITKNSRKSIERMCVNKVHSDSDANNLLKSKPQLIKRIKSVTLRTIQHKNSDNIALHKNVIKGTNKNEKNIAKHRMQNLRKSLEQGKKSNSSTKINKQIQLLPSGDKLQSPPSDAATTLKDLVERTSANDFSEEMEWEPIEVERIMFEVQAVRTELGANTDFSCSQSLPENILALHPTLEDRSKLYIVIDTNVFLSNLNIIKEARDITFRTYGEPVLVIPWTVIQELDCIKDDKFRQRSEVLKSKARRAIQFLNQNFSAKHPRVLGQRPEDVLNNKSKFEIDCPDDEILQTCLQIRESNKSVVLLSYDQNLCNKAMIFDINCLGSKDPLEKVDYLNASEQLNKSCSLRLDENNSSENNLESNLLSDRQLLVANEILEEVKEIIKSFLSVIVSKEMYNLYGDNWERYTIISPPWTIITVLKCAIKHWIAAVNESFLRKAEPLLKDLLKFFNDSPAAGRKLTDIAVILDHCKDLILMVKTDKHPELMVQAMSGIESLRNKVNTFINQIHEERMNDRVGAVSNIVVEEEARASKAFQYFEEIYEFSRDMCGLAGEAAGIPCNFFYKKPNPLPSLTYVKRIQPELAANLNKLLLLLSTAMEEMINLTLTDRTLSELQHMLTNFLNEENSKLTKDLTILDVYSCLKQRKDVLKQGIRQLQELSTHLCRLATLKCT
ncbi:transcriptional protein SWT1 isoform X2 [Prorops nasuta]|uniref:transcriptional protein SWT1 isoform X2 n=1 Tax=Prorops nasuta TaxID=863751 RepID=UPI0034CE4AA3